MSKKIIGIPGYVHDGNNRSFGVASTYLEFISHFGNPRIIMPWEEKVDCDLLLLPGGKDLNPYFYNEVPGYYTGNGDVFQEYFFKERLKNYIDNTPIFGICRGFQELAVFFKSKLKQDLIFHEQSTDRWKEAHEVYTKIRQDNDGDWMISKAGDKFKVNSHHHQGVLLSQLNQEELIPTLFAEYYPPVDKTEGYVLVEAFRHKTLSISAVQAHPEEMYFDFSIEEMNYLLNI